MQKVFERSLIVPVRYSQEELNRIDKMVKSLGLRSRSSLIRDATLQYLRNQGATKIIEIRGNVSLSQAKREILAYLKDRKEAETFDIANDLRLDLKLAVKALNELWEEGKVE